MEINKKSTCDLDGPLGDTNAIHIHVYLPSLSFRFPYRLTLEALSFRTRSEIIALTSTLTPTHIRPPTPSPSFPSNLTSTPPFPSLAISPYRLTLRRAAAKIRPVQRARLLNAGAIVQRQRDAECRVERKGGGHHAAIDEAQLALVHHLGR
jgi:hypothetical protein